MKATVKPCEDTLWESNFLKYLQSIACIFGLAIPNLQFYRGLSVWYILYTVIVLASMVAIFIIAALKWIDLFQVQILGTIIILNCMCLAIMTFSNIVAILSAVIFKRKGIVHLVKIMKTVDKVMNANNWVMESNKNFARVFIGMHICICLQITMESAFYTSAFGVSSLMNALLNGFLMYIHTINVLQISSFPLRINHRCISLYKVLHRLLTSTQKATQVQEFHKILHDTRTLLKIYDNICDMFEIVSRCFGVQMILVVCVSVIFIVKGFNTCIKYSLKKIHLAHKEHEYPLLFINLCRCMTFIVIAS